MKKLLTLLTVVVAFWACSKESSNVPPAPAPQAAPAAAPAAQEPVPAQQEPVLLISEYSFPALNGGEKFVVKTDSQKPLLVASMAGFCGFCKKMIPYVDELAGEYKVQDVDIIIAFVDQTGDELKNLEPVQNIKNVPVYYNGNQFAQDMKLEGFPTFYLIHNGKSIQKWVGFNPGYVDFMSQEIDKLIK